MKKLSKVFAMLLAVALCLCMAPAAFAAGTGSITVENSTAGATYTLWKIFEATQSSDSIAAPTPNPDGTTPAVPSYIAYLATGTQKAAYEDLEDNPFSFTNHNSDGKYTVGIADGKSVQDVIDFLKAHITAQKDAEGNITDYTCTLPEATKAATQPGNNGSIKFSGLDYGYYFITSTVGATVTIDSTNPNATVIDKNQQPKFNKTMTEVEGDGGFGTNTDPANDGDYGDTIHYVIDADATNYHNGEKEQKVQSYYLLDKLDPGLSYVKDSLIVKIVTSDTTAETYASASSILKGEATIKWYKGDDDQVGHTGFTEGDDRFSVFLPWVDEEGNSLYPANCKIVVTYDATINEGAKIGKDGNFNTAHFWVGDDVKPPEGPEPSKDWGEDMGEKKTVTYTYALALLKVDENMNKLAGAEFELTGPDGNNKKIIARMTEAGVYEYVGVLEEGKSVPDGCTTTFVTDEDGKFVLKGIDKGTYTATETKAPAGFNLLDKDVTVLADTVIGKTSEEYHYHSEWYVEKDSEGNVTVSTSTSTAEDTITSEVFDVDVEAAAFSVENHQGNLLPSTGGIGTTIFYVAGGALVLVALVLLITKKRMGNKE